MAENRNQCPWCKQYFVVSSMLTYHLENNQCGMAR